MKKIDVFSATPEEVTALVKEAVRDRDKLEGPDYVTLMDKNGKMYTVPKNQQEDKQLGGED